MKNKMLVPLLVLILLSACSGNATPEPTYTPPPSETPTPLPTPTVEPTRTPVPTSTPTSTPTVDFSVIKYEAIIFSGSSQMSIVFALNGVEGDFYAMGNEYRYECSTLPDVPGKLYCTGAYQAPGRELLVALFTVERSDPVLLLDVIVPSNIPPTPYGMQCEIEPLWVGHGGGVGCYAITCYVNGSVYDSSPDTCVEPWPWPIP